MRKKKELNDEKVHKKDLKARIEIVRGSMVNDIEEKCLNTIENLYVKVSRYLGASSLDITDHIKSSLREEQKMNQIMLTIQVM